MPRTSLGVPAVFLDRDGVLNRAMVTDGRPYPPRDIEQFELLPGVVAGCRTLVDAGFLLVVVTNQPDIARGTQDPAVIESMHGRLRNLLPVAGIYVCPHDDADRCPCRKPAPGLLLAAAQELQIDLARSVMVGDRWRDIRAGREAGCRTVFVDHGYAEQQPEGQDRTVSSFADAVRWITSIEPQAWSALAHPSAQM